MKNFRVKITGDDSTIHIGDDVSRINVEDGLITIDHGDDERAIHRTDMTKEIVITFDR